MPTEIEKLAKKADAMLGHLNGRYQGLMNEHVNLQGELSLAMGEIKELKDQIAEMSKAPEPEPEAPGWVEDTPREAAE